MTIRNEQLRKARSRTRIERTIRKGALRKAVFLDRDGTLIELATGNEAYGFILREADCRIIAGVPETLRSLRRKGYLLFVITNQPAVARGIVRYPEVEKLHQRMNARLGNLIDRFYFCPHHPEMHPDVPAYAKRYRVRCACRKPAPGLLLEAARDFNVDLTKSWMIGDMITDVAAGAAAGCKTILLESPANDRLIVTAEPFDTRIKPDRRAQNLKDALRFL